MMPLTDANALGADGGLWIAPLLGLAFGFLLERAGLGHAPKLAGQFYFTDFTVFKVLFSALLTAMLGAFWLARLGVLDLGRVYIPETFVLAQAIGGVLFGAGFLLSGLCPGTSCVAAASGRIDGLAVIGGLFAGIFGFNVAFDFIQPVYSATSLGRITLAQLVGLPTGMVVTAITLVAVSGFIVFGRMNREASTSGNSPVRARVLLATAAAFALAAGLFDDRPSVLASPLVSADPVDQVSISVIDLGERIARGDQSLRVIDLRGLADYEQFHIPTASHTTLSELANAPLSAGIMLVLYGDTGVSAAQAQKVLQHRGYPSVLILREGVNEWISRVREPRLASDATPAERQEFERAARLSRFFGGVPLAGVPRSQISTSPRPLRGRGC